MELHPVERAVTKLPKHRELKIAGAEGKILLESGFYQRDIGLKQGKHYRRKFGRGNFHLRITKDGVFLHWDKWDPRRYPVQHFLEVPGLWKPIATGALSGAAAGALVARYKGQGVLKGAAIGGLYGLSKSVEKLIRSSS